jgi:putative colanic acid biosysnthesis UDP-glucose lipid carrier transferase
MLANLERQKFGSVLRARLTLTSAIEMFLDPLIAVLCLLGAGFYHGEDLDARFLILSLLVFSLTFPGSLKLIDSPQRIARKAFMNWTAIACILLAFGYGTGYERFFPDKVLFGWIGSTYIVLIGGQLGIRYILPWLLSEKESASAVIVGANVLGETLARQLDVARYTGIHFLGYFDDRTPERLCSNGHTAPTPLLGKLCELSDYVKTNHVDQVYLSLPMATQPRILKLLDDMKDTTASIFFVPDIFVTDLIQGRMETLNGMPVVAVCETPFTGLNGIIKRISDVVLATLILLLIWPVLGVCALCVKFSSPGPIIFQQRRYGLDGREIVVYKFRSMRVCEDGGLVKQATRNDQRVTRFGAFARKTSLDELPQFINVLQGRMSIVGPRPHAVSHNEIYRTKIKGYMVRHKVKPGITGWAQVNGCRGETQTVDKMEKRIEYDLEYLRNWSLSLDLWIIVKTIGQVLRNSEEAY